VKPLLDRLCAIIGIVVLFPVMLTVAIMVRIKIGSPILFIQERPGKDEEIFKLLKFRTMSYQTDDKGGLLDDELRLTSFGSFLRSTSLDELPELFNILNGTMSFVGPRPLLVEYLPIYKEEQKRRHLVKPGITGWAQVKGRNLIPWNERFEQDVWYVDNLSFLLDLKIAIMTIGVVFSRKGISSETSQTMEYFTGSNDDGPC